MLIKSFSKLFLLLFLTAFFHFASFNQTKAEIIDIQNEEKTFGDWKVFCETDAMMDIAHCKIGAKFYDNTAVINIEPTTKFLNQFFIVIPQIKIGSFVKIRVDKNDLILSQNANAKNFGLIPLNDNQKNALYQQMKLGDFLFLRFNIQGLDKEITARISLKDFRNALEYHNSRISK
jgi:hypothetical protein